MTVRPIHPTATTSLVEAILNGRLTGAADDAYFSITETRPTALLTGQFVLCTGCLGVLHSFPRLRFRPVAHACHGKSESLASSFLAMSANARMTRALARAALDNASIQLKADADGIGLVRLSNQPDIETRFRTVVHSLAAMEKTKPAELPILDLTAYMAKPCNVARAAAMFGATAELHTLRTPSMSDMLGVVGDIGVGYVPPLKALVYQAPGMHLPVLLDSDLRILDLVMSDGARAALAYLALNSSNADNSSTQRVRQYGRVGASLDELAKNAIQTLSPRSYMTQPAQY
ncbi:VP7 [Marbled eel reovirus]|nr:VP7 [Marbled eel reovirus]